MGASAAVDVLVSNATLQWVPGHLDLLDRFAGWLAPGGWLAVQVPGNFGEPSHTLLAEVAAGPAGGSGWRTSPGRPWRSPRRTWRAWRTWAWTSTRGRRHLQVLPGEDAVLQWMRGTGLRPVLSALDDASARGFEAEYGELLRPAYPRRPFGTVLPYRRIFFVGRQASQRRG